MKNCENLIRLFELSWDEKKLIREGRWCSAVAEYRIRTGSGYEYASWVVKAYKSSLGSDCLE